MTLLLGDCLDVMAGMEPDSIDAICTDPPYGLRFMSKDWDNLDTKMTGHVEWGAATASSHRDTYQDLPRQQHWHSAWATAALRVARPGAYLLAFGGTRTVHRMTVALEDAGWIIRDVLCWVYASGFPKSKSSLKPAWEPIVLCRKPGPLQPLGIDAARIAADSMREDLARGRPPRTGGVVGQWAGQSDAGYESPTGRWPANVVLTDPAFDGGWDGVVGGGEVKSGVAVNRNRTGGSGGYGGWAEGSGEDVGYGDTGTYSRFFMLGDSRTGALSGTMGACQTCGAPVAEPSSTARTRPPDIAPNDAATTPAERTEQAAPGADNRSDSCETASAPRHVPTPTDGTLDSTESGDRSPTASDTSATETSIWPEQEPDTRSPSVPPAKRAARPKTSTGTTTTTPSPLTCARCADAATWSSTQPPQRPTEPELLGDGLPEDHPRFYIVSKASRSDREPVMPGLLEERVVSVWGGDEDDLSEGKKSTRPRRNQHPTVKPIELMRHLVRLVTPAGGTVLDPFAGSGTTGIACENEGFDYVLIEREQSYVDIIEARLQGNQQGLGLSA